ncbi:MAG: hypothetical protein ACOC10_05030, partial [Bacteroidota bacterium]
EALFQYNFKSAESFKADLLYLNPDKQAPLSSCGYERNNEKCMGGKLVDVNTKPIIENNIQKLCPSCGFNKHLSGGAGNLITIDFNNQAVLDGKVNPSTELVRYISPDITGVQTQYDRIRELEDRITKSIVGEDNVITRESINELQQEAKYQSKENVLSEIADRYSEIIEFTEKTICKLRYGERFISNSYFMGSKFFIRTVDELMLMKEKTTNPIERSDIQKQIIELRYKNNPKKKKRELLLYDLLPYSSVSDAVFNEYVTAGRINDNDFILRTNFDNIISEFEMQRGDIVNFIDTFFNENVSMYSRIQTIKSLISEIISTNYSLKTTQNVVQD